MMVSIGKLVHQKPRPYYISEDVQAFQCIPGFEAPSDNAEFVVGALGTLWLAMAELNKEKCVLGAKICTASFLSIIVVITYITRL